jgi:Skp family chaperone for outer membrane proteins
MRRQVVWAGAAVLALGLTLATAGAARAEFKAGVVDIVEVTNGYQRTKDASDDLKREMGDLKDETDRRVAKLTDLRVRRDALESGSKDWRDLDDKLLNEEAQVRAWAMVEQVKIERRHRDVLLGMYRQITAVVSKLAKDKALDVVFTKAFLSPPNIDVDKAEGLEDLKNRILGQRILYPANVMDLTTEVTNILNKEYEAARKAAGLAPSKGADIAPKAGDAMPKAVPAPKAGADLPMTVPTPRVAPTPRG